MDIITDLPKNFTDDEIDAAFMQEIKNGFKLERETDGVIAVNTEKNTPATTAVARPRS